MGGNPEEPLGFFMVPLSFLLTTVAMGLTMGQVIYNADRCDWCCKGLF
jgi:hypothetical protein